MKLLTIVYYKLKMMASDRIFISAMIFIPVFITLATGLALRHEKLGIVPIVFVDEDASGDSQLLVERMQRKEGLAVEILERKKAGEVLIQNKAEAVFLIKKGFSEKLKAGNNIELIDFIKSPSSYSSEYIAELVAGEVLRTYSGYMAANSVVSKYNKLGRATGEELFNEVMKYTDSFWEPEPLMKMEYYEIKGGEPGRQSFYMPAATATSAGIITVFIMLYILFCSGWLIEERTNGTLKRLIAGMGSLSLTYAANITAMFISGMFQIFLFAVIIKLVFGVVLFTGVLSYLVMASYLICVISISMLLSSILKTTAQLQSTAPFIALVTGFIGGCFWNFVDVPHRIKILSRLTPQGWALSAINSLIIGSRLTKDILLAFSVLLIIPLILLPLSYIIIRAGMRSGRIST